LLRELLILFNIEDKTFEFQTFINPDITQIRMAKELACLSCKRKVMNEAGTVIFNCPSCGKSQIVRCGHCRNIAAKYKCHECGFSGPN
jgi:predicted RNA-binding Zn-ribbon protein involved in translation (DUF1610 family)